jgi:Smg protein
MLVPSSTYRYITSMFDVLVYLYETYYRPDACPDSDALAKKLSAVGFEQEEISRALGWLTDLAETTNEMFSQQARQTAFSFGFRVYAEREYEILGTPAIGFIQFLESAEVVNALQREIVIERACATNESPISLDKLKVIVLMVLWSQGKEPDGLMFDELFLDDEDIKPPLYH